jgi:PIN domain nuclease of toxin-antitoxin system
MILLDTHAWIWWLSAPNELSPKALAAVERGVQESEVYVSSISVWEAALLVERGRLVLSMPFNDWLSRCESLPFLHFVPVDNRIAVRAVHLPGDFHKDPADRIITATAMEKNLLLVTLDRKLRGYPHVRTVW